VSTDVQIDIAVREPAQLGQAPTWDPGSGTLLWVDVLASVVHRFTPGGSDHSLRVPQPVSAAKPRSHGGLVLTLAEGIALFEANAERRTWLVYWARDGVRGSQTAVDSKGRLWAGTARPDETGGGWLARVAPDGAATVVLDDVAGGNGVAWSPDDDHMYFVDSPTGRIDVLDFDATSGQAIGRRVFCEITGSEGEPTGTCVDEAGCVWVVLRGGAELRRYTPEGALDRSVALPARRPTGCCFGGADLTDLYVTSARSGVETPADTDGAVLVLPGIGKGLRTPAFAG
jgi:sugar lactone lactonase YvrE